MNATTKPAKATREEAKPAQRSERALLKHCVT
jgi:hypothetical protein